MTTPAVQEAVGLYRTIFHGARQDVPGFTYQTLNDRVTKLTPQEFEEYTNETSPPTQAPTPTNYPGVGLDAVTEVLNTQKLFANKLARLTPPQFNEFIRRLGM